MLLKSLLNLDVLVCAGVSLGLSDGDESFGVCWIITKTTIQIHGNMKYLNIYKVNFTPRLTTYGFWNKLTHLMSE